MQLKMRGFTKKEIEYFKNTELMNGYVLIKPFKPIASKTLAIDTRLIGELRKRFQTKGIVCPCTNNPEEIEPGTIIQWGLEAFKDFVYLEDLEKEATGGYYMLITLDSIRLVDNNMEKNEDHLVAMEKDAEKVIKPPMVAMETNITSAMEEESRLGS